MGLFGNFFDFDGDGKASMFEDLLGMELMGFFDSDEEDEDEYEEEDEEEDTEGDDP